MNRIRLSTFLLILAVAVISLGYMSSSFAGKKCDEDPTHPSCGGDVDDPPVTSAQYTAALVEGAFRFKAVDVTLNKKGNSYSSVVKLDMVRPDSGTSVPSEQDPWVSGDQLAWDDVFSVCPELFSDNAVGSVMANDNWSIDNGGPKNAGNAGTNIRIQLRDVSVPGFVADLDIGLIGVVGVGNELDRLCDWDGVALEQALLDGGAEAFARHKRAVALIDLIRWLLRANPRERPGGAKEMIKHFFFQDDLSSGMRGPYSSGGGGMLV